MPPRRRRPDLSPEASVGHEIARILDRSGPAIAAQLGPQPDTRKLPPAQEEAMWTFELTPEVIARAAFDPAVKQLVDDVKKRTEPLIAQGATAEAAALARFPFRQQLYATGRPKIADQIRYAEAMAKRTGHTEPLPPPPPPPAPEPQPAPPGPSMIQPPDAGMGAAPAPEQPQVAPAGMVPLVTAPQESGYG